MNAPGLIPRSAAPVFPVALMEALASFGVAFRRQDAGLALRDPEHRLSDELRQACREHQEPLLRIADLRDGFARLMDRIERLRSSDPPKGTREAALSWLCRQIEDLERLADAPGVGRDPSGHPSGWADPADPFADGDQLALLRAELDELRAGPYPLPMDPDRSPFAQGRLYSGRVVGGLTLAGFAESGRVVALFSGVLGEEIVFAADNACVPQDEARPIYRARELAGLTHWTPDGLRRLHEAKAGWEGGAEVLSDLARHGGSLTPPGPHETRP